MKENSVIIKPVLTEKSVKLAGKGKYTFLVSSRAKKPQIKAAFSKVYGVVVGDIKTAKKRIKRKKVFKKGGWQTARYQRETKKAIVEIKDGKDKLSKLFKF